jgi:hypothetical protein
MKRSEVIGKLISEHGFTEKTLVNMDDKQIFMLGNRILGEQISTSAVSTPAVNIPKTNKPAIDQAKRNKETFLTYEGEVKEEDETEEKKVEKKLPKKGKTPEKLKENKSMKTWIKGLVESQYHPITSKGEIVQLVRQRINEVETMQPMPKHKPKKGHNGIPEWLTYKSIKNSGEPATKPVTKPAPTQEPGTAPTKRPHKVPFQPGIRVNPKPKALAETKPATKPAPTKNPETAPTKRPHKVPFQPGIRVNPKTKAVSESKPNFIKSRK